MSEHGEEMEIVRASPEELTDIGLRFGVERVEGESDTIHRGRVLHALAEKRLEHQKVSPGDAFGGVAGR